MDDDHTSDHFPILITHLHQQNPVKEKRFKTSKADWAKYKTQLTESIPEFDDALDVEESYSILKDCIIQAAEASIPKTGAGKRQEVPWWSKEMQELLHEKHKLSNLMIRTKRKLNKLLETNNHTYEQMGKIIQLSTEISEIRPILNRTRAKFKRKAMLGRKESWEAYVSSINSRTPIKKIWRRFKKVSGSCPSPPKHAININGQRVHETKDICDAIARKIEETSSDQFYTEEFLRHKNAEERREIQFHINEQSPEHYNEPLTLEELEHTLNTAKDTAPGQDQIKTIMLKQMPPNGKQYMLKLFNKIWNQNVFPAEWRESIIIPIPKPGKDPSNPGNYRPIALTSCVCKAMERIVNGRLTRVLKEKNVITPTQTGAEKGRSTLEPLINLENYVRQ